MEHSSSCSNGHNSPKPPTACQICNQTKSAMVPAALIRPVIVAEIQKSHPGFSIAGHICSDDLNRFRFQYVQGLPASEKGELTALDHEVLDRSSALAPVGAAGGDSADPDGADGRGSGPPNLTHKEA